MNENFPGGGLYGGVPGGAARSIIFDGVNYVLQIQITASNQYKSANPVKKNFELD